MGQTPDFIIIQKVDGKWKKVGAAWNSDKGGFNLSIGERGKEERYIMKVDDYQQKKDSGFFDKKDAVAQEELDDSIPF